MSSNLIPFDPTLLYLGVTLDQSLTFRQHIEKLKNKMTFKVALVKRLVGLNWGACFDALCISTPINGIRAQTKERRHKDEET